MGRIGLPELFIILFIVVLIFGANRLPQLATGIGKAIRSFKASRKGRARRTIHLASPALPFRRSPDLDAASALHLLSCFGRALLCRGRGCARRS